MEVMSVEAGKLKLLGLNIRLDIVLSVFDQLLLVIV